jgi:hypothetical protein
MCMKNDEDKKVSQLPSETFVEFELLGIDQIDIALVALLILRNTLRKAKDQLSPDHKQARKTFTKERGIERLALDVMKRTHRPRRTIRSHQAPERSLKRQPKVHRKLSILK